MITPEARDWLWDRCINHQHGLMAASGSDLDKKLQELEDAGAVKLYDSMFGNHYYSLTDEGKNLLNPAAAHARIAALIRSVVDGRDDYTARLYRALADAIERGEHAPPEDDGWRPIETAPCAMRVLVCGQYLSARGAARYAVSRGDWRWIDDFNNEISPTHWRQLPPPPRACLGMEPHCCEGERPNCAPEPQREDGE